MTTVSLSFNNLLAYLLPGVVALYPVGLLLPQVSRRVWAMPANDGPHWSAILFGFVAVALLLGLAIDAIRYVIVDWPISGIIFGGKLPEHLAKLRKDADLKTVQSAVIAAYAHHQFYVNTALGLLAIIVMWTCGFNKPAMSIMVVTGSLCAILLLAGCRVYWTAASQLKACLPDQNAALPS